jgi:hypothetical protein
VKIRLIINICGPDVVGIFILIHVKYIEEDKLLRHI